MCDVENFVSQLSDEHRNSYREKNQKPSYDAHNLRFLAIFSEVVCADEGGEVDGGVKDHRYHERIASNSMQNIKTLVRVCC